MLNLVWVRAANRDSLADLLQALSEFDSPPPPDKKTDTSQLELDLAIGPRRGYYYLGKTRESFGRFAYALPLTSFVSAEVSPCDSGGLVRRIEPVRAWEHGRRVDYLKSATWPQAELALLLEAYPGLETERVKRYLAGDRPSQSGPHEIWNRVVEAPIWALNTDCRAWTWEARTLGHVETGTNIVAWSCEPALANDLLDRIIAAAGDPLAQWASHLFDTYIEGGVGFLVRYLQGTQVAA